MLFPSYRLPGDHTFFVSLLIVKDKAIAGETVSIDILSVLSPLPQSCFFCFSLTLVFLSFVLNYLLCGRNIRRHYLFFSFPKCGSGLVTNLMIGIFTLYLKDSADGFNMDEKDASSLYGTFIALVFFTPFLGGLLADRYLGYRRSIIMGGLLMSAGYCLMSVHTTEMLYISMALVIIGNGFF